MSEEEKKGQGEKPKGQDDRQRRKRRRRRPKAPESGGPQAEKAGAAPAKAGERPAGENKNRRRRRPGRGGGARGKGQEQNKPAVKEEGQKKSEPRAASDEGRPGGRRRGQGRQAGARENERQGGRPSSARGQRPSDERQKGSPQRGPSRGGPRRKETTTEILARLRPIQVAYKRPFNLIRTGAWLKMQEREIEQSIGTPLIDLEEARAKMEKFNEQRQDPADRMPKENKKPKLDPSFFIEDDEENGAGVPTSADAGQAAPEETPKADAG